MLTFGIPTQRTVKVEKYPDTPVLTINATPVEQGKGYKFNLNPKACELLGCNFDNDVFVSFAFNEENVYIANTSDNPNVHDRAKYRVGKTNKSFSNKPAHQYIQKHNLLGFNGEELEVRLVADQGAFKLVNLVDNTEEPQVESSEDVVTNAFVANVPNEPVATNIFE